MDYYVSQEGLKKLVKLGMMNYAVFETLVKMKADDGEMIAPKFGELEVRITDDKIYSMRLAEFCCYVDEMLSAGLLVEAGFGSYDLNPKYFRLEL